MDDDEYKSTYKTFLDNIMNSSSLGLNSMTSLNDILDKISSSIKEAEISTKSTPDIEKVCEALSVQNYIEDLIANYLDNMLILIGSAVKEGLLDIEIYGELVDACNSKNSEQLLKIHKEIEEKIVL